MKGKLFGLLILCSLLASLGGAGSALAQSPLPPVPPVPYHGPQRSSAWTPESGPQRTSQPAAPATDLGTQSVTLGPSGLSFRYLKTFGSTGVAYLADHTHLNYPWGLGASGSNIWIGELWGNRALKYTGAGDYLQQIGTAGFPYPYHDSTDIKEIADVAADAGGNIWVVDDKAAHVAEFDSAGTFLKELGVLYAPGTDNSHFAYPVSIAFDASGNIYVSDGAPWWDGNLGNQRIQIFDSAGSYIATIGETGVVGTANDHFDGPRHIAVYGSQLYVSDARNHRVQIYDVTTPSAPVYVATLGTTGVSGTGAAQFNNPSGVAVDADYIYVADTDNNRVRVFDHTLALVATIGGTWGTASNQFKNPIDVAVDADHKLYVADWVNLRVQQFTHSGPAFTFARTYGVTGVPYLTDSSHYNHPSGVAVASDGSIYLTEDMGQRLIKLNASGVLLWSVGAAGVKGDWDTATNRLDNPADVAVDSSSHVYVADRWHGRVQIYNSLSGAYIASISGLGCPGGVHVDNPHGLLYVADSCDSTVKIYTTTTRTLVATLGVSGVAGFDNAHFDGPQDVAVDGLGTIYVADQNNNRVQVFNASRVYVRSMGTPGVCGEKFDQLCSPDSLAVDGGNRVYVSEGGNNRVQVFDSSGAYLTTIAGGWGPGSGQLRSAAGVAVDTTGNVYVADWDNDRIQKFAPGTPGWSQMNINGFGDRGVVDTEVLAPFGGQLYAAAYSDVGQIWRTTNGTTWSSMVTDGFGDPGNATIPQLAEFNGKLYAGTWNCASADCTTSNGAQIWRTDGSTWSAVMTGGFGSTNNFAVNTLTVFSGKLYAATSAGDGVIKIYRSATGDSGSWAPVMTDGFGGSGVSTDLTTAIYGGYLYVGLGRTSLAELWRCQICDGSDWSSVFTNGLGNVHNDGVRSIAGFNGVLYVGLRNVTTGGELWKSTNGTTFTRVFAGGLGKVANARPDGLYSSGGFLYLVFSNTVNGAEVWRSLDGINWTSLASAGWGDPNNIFADYMNKGAAAFGSGGGQLFIGTSNLGNGAEIWSAPLPQLRSYQSAGAQDGWILESSETSGLGGSLNSIATTFNLGDDAANKQYRAFLSFNTAPLPDTAVIQSAILKIQQSGVPVGGNPFSVLGSLLVDVRRPYFGTLAGLQLGDFSAAPSAAKVGAFGKTPSGGWYSVSLNAAGLTNINKTGTTQFRLYFSLDDNNNHVANLMRFLSGNAPLANRPLLVITYMP